MPLRMGMLRYCDFLFKARKTRLVGIYTLRAIAKWKALKICMKNLVSIESDSLVEDEKL